MKLSWFNRLHRFTQAANTFNPFRNIYNFHPSRVSQRSFFSQNAIQGHPHARPNQPELASTRYTKTDPLAEIQQQLFAQLEPVKIEDETSDPESRGPNNNRLLMAIPFMRSQGHGADQALQLQANQRTLHNRLIAKLQQLHGEIPKVSEQQSQSHLYEYQLDLCPFCSHGPVLDATDIIDDTKAERLDELLSVLPQNSDIRLDITHLQYQVQLKLRDTGLSHRALLTPLDKLQSLWQMGHIADMISFHSHRIKLIADLDYVDNNPLVAHFKMGGLEHILEHIPADEIIFDGSNGLNPQRVSQAIHDMESMGIPVTWKNHIQPDGKLLDKLKGSNCVASMKPGP